eukprot:m.181051 g.181051  ORF g.181051 m.181051 type:complete len:67 (+) comp16624_c2_seq3:1194-1394(+)
MFDSLKDKASVHNIFTSDVYFAVSAMDSKKEKEKPQEAAKVKKHKTNENHLSAGSGESFFILDYIY